MPVSEPEMSFLAPY